MNLLSNRPDFVHTYNQLLQKSDIEKNKILKSILLSTNSESTQIADNFFSEVGISYPTSLYFYWLKNGSADFHKQIEKVYEKVFDEFMNEDQKMGIRRIMEIVSIHLTGLSHDFIKRKIFIAESVSIKNQIFEDFELNLRLLRIKIKGPENTHVRYNLQDDKNNPNPKIIYRIIGIYLNMKDNPKEAFQIFLTLGALWSKEYIEPFQKHLNTYLTTTCFHLLKYPDHRSYFVKETMQLSDAWMVSLLSNIIMKPPFAKYADDMLIISQEKQCYPFLLRFAYQKYLKENNDIADNLEKSNDLEVYNKYLFEYLIPPKIADGKFTAMKKKQKQSKITNEEFVEPSKFTEGFLTQGVNAIDDEVKNIESGK